MSRFLIKPDLPFYLSGLAGKGDMFSSDYLCNLHTIVTIAHISSQFTHFCCDVWYFVSIYALMLQFLQVCRNLRTFVVVPENLRFTHLRAKKKCESWVPSQKNRISSHATKWDYTVIELFFSSFIMTMGTHIVSSNRTGHSLVGARGICVGVETRCTLLASPFLWTILLSKTKIQSWLV